jgi:prophage regulatory protein
MSKESVAFVRYQEAAKLLGVSRFTLWRWSREGLFPKPIKLGPNTSGFLLKDIQSFMTSRKTLSRRRK